MHAKKFSAVRVASPTCLSITYQPAGMCLAPFGLHVIAIIPCQRGNQILKRTPPVFGACAYASPVYIVPGVWL